MSMNPTKSAFKFACFTVIAICLYLVPANMQRAQADILGGAIGGALIGGLFGGGDGAIGGAIMGGVIGGAAQATRNHYRRGGPPPRYRRQMNRRHNTFRSAPGYQGRGGSNARAAAARRARARSR